MATSSPTQDPDPTKTSSDEQFNTPAEDVIGIGVAATLILTVALFLLSPWAPQYSAGSATLNRYAPVKDGDSLLLTQYDSAGKLLGWQSQNIAILAKARALAGQIPSAARQSIERYFGTPGASANAVDPSANLEQYTDVDFQQTHTSQVDAAGNLRFSSALYAHSSRGEFLVSLDLPDQQVVFDPPAQTLPADLRLGNAWITTGTLSNNLSYAYQGAISATGAYISTAARFDDCVQVDATLSLSRLSQVVSVQHTHSWYCAGVGLVEQQTLDSQGAVTSRDVLVSSDQVRPLPDRLPIAAGSAPAPATQALLPAVDLGAWHLTRVSRMGQDVAAGSSTILPVWIPTTPPMVLAAAYNGDLVAFDAGDPTGVTLWQYHTRGTIYSPPAYDATRNRIYFGSTDKHLYALDTRGLFLWSFETGDSIASRPVVISDTIIFGSEDRSIYGLNADTGALRWKVKTGAAIVSSPAALMLAGAAGESSVIVVIGSDDGGIYALDPTTGAQRWLFTASAAVEAPLVAADGVVYAASRDRTLYAIDGWSGSGLWSADASEVLRNAPLVSPDAVYVVDDARRMHAFRRTDGKGLWVTADQVYVGTPVLLGQTLLAATRDDQVRRLSLDGQPLGQWEISDVIGSGQVYPSNDLGLAVAGTSADDLSLWYADDQAVVRRLGGGLAGATPLTAGWVKANTDDAFQSDFYSSAAATPYQGKALVVDGNRQIHLIDPASGAATLMGGVAVQAGYPIVDPVLDGDSLLVSIADTLYATHLPEAKPLWKVKGDGISLQPVTVAGDVGLWLTQQDSTAPPLAGTLRAINLGDGSVRWQQPISGFTQVGNAIVDAPHHLVFISSPPSAFDLDSGKRLWQMPVQVSGGLALGGGWLNEAGDTLYVGLYQTEGDNGSIAAINTANGNLRWVAGLGHDTLAALDRIWLDGNLLIVPTTGNRVVALDAASGAQRWQYQPPRQRFGAISVEAAPHSGRVWLAQQDGVVLALDPASGKPVARYSDVPLSLNSDSLAQHPMFIGGKVVAALGLRLLGLNLPTE